VIWSAADLAQAIHRAVDHKSELRSMWPAALRRRFPRAGLLAVLDEHQRWEELQQIVYLVAINTVALIDWSDDAPQVVSERRSSAREASVSTKNLCQGSTRKPSTSEQLPSRLHPSARWPAEIWRPCASLQIIRAARCRPWAQ